MPETGRCLVCDRHLELAMKQYDDGRKRPRLHYINGERCPGCDVPAQPRSREYKARVQHDNLSVIYDAIAGYMEREQMPPSVRDISMIVKMSPTAVYYNLQRLEEAGRLELRKGVSRGIILKGRNA